MSEQYSARRSAMLEDRFWNKVSRDPVGCWRWTAVLSTSGYGLVWDGVLGGTRSVQAHRQAWRYTRGDIPDGLCVLHSCDNPACVRPSHLFIGTHSDNMRDMYAKGRHVIGAKKPTICVRERRKRLTAPQVLAILRSPESQRALALRYGIGQTTVSCIKRRQSWRHLRFSEAEK
jgi:hypothetical protein